VFVIDARCKHEDYSESVFIFFFFGPKWKLGICYMSGELSRRWLRISLNSLVNIWMWILEDILRQLASRTLWLLFLSALSLAVNNGLNVTFPSLIIENWIPRIERIQLTSTVCSGISEMPHSPVGTPRARALTRPALNKLLWRQRAQLGEVAFQDFSTQITVSIWQSPEIVELITLIIADSHSRHQEVPSSCGTPSLISVFIRTCHWTLYWMK